MVDVWIRLGFFSILATILIVVERSFVGYRLRRPRIERWLANWTLGGCNALAIRSLIPITSIQWAEWTADSGWSVLPITTLGALPAFISGIILLDLAIYWQHRLLHRIPILWRLHRVHHSDLDQDVSTGLRFHPLEALLSALYRMVVIGLFGIPSIAVLAFEILLNATSMFSHTNVKLTRVADKILRLIIVTPDMHRIHHSSQVSESLSNFGFNLTWWDYLFRSYRDRPGSGQENLELGVQNCYQQPQDHRLLPLLSQPFK